MSKTYAPQDLVLSLGVDPEFFLKNDKGVNISAHGLVPGSKKEPHRLNNGAVQLDGTAVEFNIDPCTTSAQFTGRIKRVLQDIKDRLPKGYNFDFSPTVHYDPVYFDKHVPQTSKELGCEPDYNAYTGKMNPIPKRKGSMATGAGHFHFGWAEDLDPLNPDHFNDCCRLVKNLDVVFNVITPFWDNDKERREMYGAPGAFRPKSYGCEYRTPSNAWVRYPNLYEYLYNVCTSVFNITKCGIDLQPITKTTIEELKSGKLPRNQFYDLRGEKTLSPPVLVKYDSILSTRHWGAKLEGEAFQREMRRYLGDNCIVFNYDANVTDHSGTISAHILGNWKEELVLK